MKPTVLLVVPLQGVAALRLGATRQEAHAAAAAHASEVTAGSKGDEEIDELFGGAIHLHYDDEDRLEAIECWKDGAVAVVLDGVDLLRRPATAALDALEALSPCAEGTEGNTCYTFPHLSIGLWRSRPSDPTFTSVLVGREGYYLD